MKIAMLLYDNVTALDFVGPYQVFGMVPGASVLTVARAAGPIRDDRGTVLFNAEYSLKDIEAADILFVPGSSDNRHVIKDGETLEWLRKVDRTTSWTTSVCTGSLILGAAGFLRNRRATTHWAALEFLKRFGAQPVAERVVIDGKYVTGAGVAAGIDMALTLVASAVGADTAQTVQLIIEYDPAPPFTAGSPAKAPAHIVEAAFARLAADATQRAGEGSSTARQATRS
jgi:transcriptional regulator GlxA family with amidase domain